MANSVDADQTAPNLVHTFVEQITFWLSGHI